MSRSYPYGQGGVRLVSTEWLSDHLTSRDLMILDVQANVHDYIAEHIPGAIYLNEGLFRDYQGHLPSTWILPKDIQDIFSLAGIRDDIPIVVYTGVGAFKRWGDGLEQTFAAYTLSRFGHKDVMVLDGGLDKWKQDGYPVSQDYPEVEPTKFKAKVRKDYFLTYKQFVKIKDHKNVILLDARPVNLYEGQGPWKKPGHIPGAISLPWASLMDDKNKAWLKPDDQVQEILDSHGVTPDKTIICSCGTGREATNEFLLFKFYLGYPKVKEHEGAFTEWLAYPENPTVTGPNPR